MDHPAALHRLKVGVPATVEHSSEAGPETGKWVAETTQVGCVVYHLTSKSVRIVSVVDRYIQAFITFMDALKLRMRAKDQLHPLLQELVTGYARFKGSKDWEGRSKMVGWCVLEYFPPLFTSHLFDRLITLNAMKASEEITEEQSRQVSHRPTLNPETRGPRSGGLSPHLISLKCSFTSTLIMRMPSSSAT
jgi:ESCRT-I complex subunit VPS28